MRKAILTVVTLAASLVTAITPAVAPSAAASGVVTSAGGAAGSVAARDTFRSVIGGGTVASANGSFGGRRREINWDGVPPQFSAPANLPGNFFNVNSPRGVVLGTPGAAVRVSAAAADGTPRFGDINPTYPSTFSAFSPEKLFTAISSTIVDVTFFVPGTTTPATVSAFGAVFTDVDTATAATIEYFDANGVSLGVYPVPAAPGSGDFSFLGVTFTGRERVSRVRITSGSVALSAAANDGGTDLAVMDDFLYSEPQPLASASVSDVTVNELDTGPATASFLVTLSTNTITTTIDYSTGDGSAGSLGDFNATSGTLTFAPGEVQKSVDVVVNADNFDEPDENFVLMLSNAPGVQVASTPGTATILDAIGDFPRTFLFAEGTTRPGFFEELDLANTLAIPISVNVTYLYSQDTPGPATTKTYTIAGFTTLAVNVANDAGSGVDVSIALSETGMTVGGLVAERQLFFDYNSNPSAPHWTGFHDAVGVASAAGHWLFGEGTTLPHFTEFLTLQNPDPAMASTVALTYQPESCDGPAPGPKTLTLPPASRTTVRVSDPTDPSGAGGVSCVGLAAEVSVTAGPAIVAERQLYFTQDFGSGPATDGHVSFGATLTAKEYFFAEGTTLPGFNEFLTLSNPGGTDAAVELDYADENGTVTTKSVTVPNGRRTTVSVFDANSIGGLGPDRTGVSTHVLSTVPIAAERPLYVVRDVGSGLVDGGHDALGALQATTRFGFAGGSTRSGFDTFLTVQNPNQTSTANLTLTFVAPSGKLKDTAVTVAPHTRSTFRYSDLAGAGIGGPVGLIVTSDVPVVVERPEYAVATVNGLTISGAGNALGFGG